MVHMARITSKGQITIPSRVRQRLGLETGDAVAFGETPGGEVVIRKITLDSLEKVQAASGLQVRAGHYFEEDVLEWVGEVREEMFRERFGVHRS